MSRALKLRYCDCGRELEYRCRVCSECRQINIDIAHDRYNASQAHKDRTKKYYREVFKDKYPSLRELKRRRENENSR